jgi:hypothetical protein
MDACDVAAGIISVVLDFAPCSPDAPNGRVSPAAFVFLGDGLDTCAFPSNRLGDSASLIDFAVADAGKLTVFEDRFLATSDLGESTLELVAKTSAAFADRALALVGEPNSCGTTLSRDFRETDHQPSPCCFSILAINDGDGSMPWRLGAGGEAGGVVRPLEESW